ncbi:hypothetical protein VTK26DRAFT_1859 [Humicola hyalothermophila]
MTKTANGINGGAVGSDNRAPKTDLLTLAGDILRQTMNIRDYLEANGIPEPTFAAGSGAVPQTPEYVLLCANLKACLEDLARLVEGPGAFWMSHAYSAIDLAALQVALRFRFFELVPAQGAISLPELATKGGLDLDRTGRVVRALLTHRIFDEKQQGWISHNATSHALHEDGDLHSFVDSALDELFKTASGAADALQAWPHGADSEHMPFRMRHGLPVFEFYQQNPERAHRFARGMRGATKAWQYIREITEMTAWFPWGRLQGTVVDVGGGSGYSSIALAKRWDQLYPHLSFVVQDSAGMLAEGAKLLTDDPVKQAAAFLMCNDIHNWRDDDAVKIFKAMVPGLEGSDPDTPFLVTGVILPESGTLPRDLERGMRRLDMTMLLSFGSKERTKAEWEALLKEADSRYEIRNARSDGLLGVLEVYLRR